MNKKTICFLLILFAFLIKIQALDRIVNIPLDERFATRIAFLNLASLTPYKISSLPQNLLPALKKWNAPDQIISWTLQQSKASSGAIISLETLLYGSLIASRVSNDTLITIKERIEMIKLIKNQNPKIKIYGSAVVMRIPEYDGDFQQPWYWAKYGKLLYTYSYYEDKFNSTKDPSDKQTSDEAKIQIPNSVLQQFVWRRNRNQQALVYLLQNLSENMGLFEQLYITLDDNAQYGFNVREAEQIKDLVRQKKLEQKVLIYPGADEVSLALLAKYSVDGSERPGPRLGMVFRNQSTSSNIPNYEGIPMIETIQYQIKAAGGTVESVSKSQIALLINNFDETKQIQAPDQLQKAPIVTYQQFSSFVCPKNYQVLGFIDNRFSNGGDIQFGHYILTKTIQCGRDIGEWAYAGWNTNGNTVGTVIANTIILTLFQNKSFMITQADKGCEICCPCPNGDIRCANSYFNTIRILQDIEWQAKIRTMLRNYIKEVPADDPNDLSRQLNFYQQYSIKPLSSIFDVGIKKIFSLPFDINGVYYPWNRTFQIGIYGQMQLKQTEQLQI